MLPEQESLIYKHFVDIVRDCDLVGIMKGLSLQDPIITKIMDNVKIENDRRHNNRCIIFQMLKTNSSTLFHELVQALRKNNLQDLADKLENKAIKRKPKHLTCCINIPLDEIAEGPSFTEQLRIDVKKATKFCDSEDCYKTRSPNRGQVLVINNIHFNDPRHHTRTGAQVDETNLREVFEKIGFFVELHRNLSSEEMKSVIEKFAQRKYEMTPDVGVVVLMSHGEQIENKTVIVGSDGKGVEEQWIIRQFSNPTCALFRNKPKILVFNVCRGNLLDSLQQFAQHTQSDSALNKKPDVVEDQRYYSDLMICHPSVEGFQAHRDTVRGCWYIEFICKVFMENAHNADVESMLKMVERGLKNRTSEKMTRQTSTFLNIAFKTCFLNPGIYEEGGVIKHFKESL